MPYFFAVLSKALIFASVISILETPVPCRISCFSVCLPRWGVSLALRKSCKSFRSAACSTFPSSFAVLIARAIVFRVTSSCNGHHSFRFFCRSQGGRTRQISHILIGFRQANRNSPGCQISAFPNQGLPCRARQGRYSSCRWWTER